MVIGRTITYKYKHFKYDETTKKLLDVNLTKAEEKELQEVYDAYSSLGVKRGYEYVIRDLYILIIKKNISTSDIAMIYGVGIRTVQLWLKELGLNRTLKEAQQIAVTKRDYTSIEKTHKRTTIGGVYESNLNESKLQYHIRNQINVLLSEELIDFEVIVGINSLSIIKTAADIPVIIIKNSKIFKYIIEVNEVYSYKSEEVDSGHDKKQELASKKGYTIISINTKSSCGEDDSTYDINLDKQLRDIVNTIVKKTKGR